MESFHFVEFLGLFHKVPMSMLGKNVRLSRDHMFELHPIYVAYQQHRHRLYTHSDQRRSKRQDNSFVSQSSLRLTLT